MAAGKEIHRKTAKLRGVSGFELTGWSAPGQMSLA